QVTYLGAVLTFDRAIECRDDARGQRPVQPEWIADSEHLLPDAKIVTRADRDRYRLILRHADLQHRDVVPETDADQRRIVVATVSKLHVGRGRTGNDVHVRHDVSRRIPDESRARAA